MARAVFCCVTKLAVADAICVKSGSGGPLVALFAADSEIGIALRPDVSAFGGPFGPNCMADFAPYRSEP